MANKASWITLTTEQQDELERFMPKLGTFKVVPHNQLPGVFSDGFRKKIDSAMVISAPTSTGGTYLAISANRIDFKDQAIDVEPFGVIVNSTGTSSSAVFLHHGNWAGRSEKMPQGFWDEIDKSGIGDYFYTNPPENMVEGALEQLPKKHRGAFDALVCEIRKHVDEQQR